MRIRSQHILFLADTLLLVIVFLSIQMYKQGTKVPELSTYAKSFVLFLGIWMLVSFVLKKYAPLKERRNILLPLSKILITSGVVLGITTTLMYLLRIAYYSRLVVFGTISLTSAVEIVSCLIYLWIKNATKAEPETLPSSKSIVRLKLRHRPQIEDSLLLKKEKLLTREALIKREEAILSELPQEAYNFIFNYIPIDSLQTYISNSVSHINIDLLPQENINAIVNLQRVNDIRYVNKYFESINSKLPNGGVYTDFLETKNLRKSRLLNKFPPGINFIYYFFDFIIKRVFPKFRITKKIYFFITRGENRVMAKAEAYGRLYSCGFEIIDEKETNGYLYFVACKIKEPIFPERPTYGPFIQLKRVGKNGKYLKVYKLRTMHPYSEFLQDYVYKKGGLEEGGKFKSDFRVTRLGKFFRTFWLDELPMLINLLKGDLKLVGVRPLSMHYFKLYPKEYRERRIKYKPGLVPPFYVDNPKSLDEIIESEKKYLDAFDKHRFKTDFSYFFMAVKNILFRKARSA